MNIIINVVNIIMAMDNLGWTIIHNGGIREPSDWLDIESLTRKTEQF